MGVEGIADGIRAQIDGDKPASLAELALLLPVQIIDPEVHHLIEEGPSRRRRFLDWGVFHVEHIFRGSLAALSAGPQAAQRRAESAAAQGRGLGVGQ